MLSAAADLAAEAVSLEAVSAEAAAAAGEAAAAVAGAGAGAAAVCRGEVVTCVRWGSGLRYCVGYARGWRS
jgi:hypothetical protein